MKKSAAEKLELYLKKNVTKHFGEESFFILGVSGGADSMALLYLFHKLDIYTLVVHINYGKRGKESDLDQELVEQLAFQWNLECCSVRLNSKKAEGENFQNWARNERYRIFRDLKEAHSADAIVTAHHRDDQVETILHKILRGSSPKAWQGMKENEGDLYRPLLSFTKQEILEFCEEEAVPFRTDESNLEAGFARNFIRHELSLRLDDFFPGWEENILAMSEKGALFEKSIGFITGQVWDGKMIDLRRYSKLPEKIKSAVIKSMLEYLDSTVSFSKGQINELAKIDKLQTGKTLEAGSFIFTRNRHKIHILKTEKEPAISEDINKVNIEDGFSAGNIIIKKSTKISFGTDLNLDVQKLNWPLKLRNWKSGDVFQPLGMRGSQKISNHLSNRKIPAHLKEKALVLCGSDGTIYAIIYPEPARNSEKGAIAELAKCESSTRIVLSIIIN